MSVQLKLLTRKELEEKEMRLLSRFPRLRGWAPSCDCRSPWCASDLTPEEIHAADELQDIAFLLGERRYGY